MGELLRWYTTLPEEQTGSDISQVNEKEACSCAGVVLIAAFLREFRTEGARTTLAFSRAGKAL